MPRLQQVAPETVTGKTAELFQGVQKKLGMVPNLMRVLGNSPAALQAYLQFSGSLATGTLDAKQRERIALAVAQANKCDYCLAAHSALGKMAGLTQEQIRDARQGHATDASSDALIRFARKVVTARGHVSDSDLAELRKHGFTDGQIAEVIGNVALNILTNYFNHVAETDVDFHPAEALQSEHSCSASDAACSIPA